MKLGFYVLPCVLQQWMQCQRQQNMQNFNMNDIELLFLMKQWLPLQIKQEETK